MNWGAVSAFAETLAALGVIVSLVYLAIQIRMSRREARHNSIDRLVELWSSFAGAIADNSDLAATVVKGLDGLDKLSEVEKAMFFAHFGRILRVSKAMYMHHIDGTISPNLWRGVDASLTDIMRTPAARQYWPIRSHWFSADFQA